jgi:hypothetical protein
VYCRTDCQSVLGLLTDWQSVLQAAEKPVPKTTKAAAKVDEPAAKSEQPAAKSANAAAATPPTKGMVWVNTESKVFHREGSR